MVSYKRHLLKSITWRILGTLDTIALTWIITGSLTVGISVGSFELFTKLLLYYLHERVWYRFIKYGILKNNSK